MRVGTKCGHPDHCALLTICNLGFTLTCVSDVAAATMSVCSGTPTINNGTFNCTGSDSVGSICSGTCGANFAGQPNATCSADGTWVNVTGSCEGKLGAAVANNWSG